MKNLSILIITISFHLSLLAQTTNVNIPITQDATVIWVNGNSNFENSNYGDGISLHPSRWTQNGDEKISRALIHFNTDLIPNGAIIESATLHLASNLLSNTGNSTEAGSNACIIQKCTSSWDEMQVTWNNQPNTVTSDSIIISSDSVLGERYLYNGNDVNVKSFLDYFISNPDSNFGLKISLLNETNHYRRKTWASQDATDTTTHPYISVTYKLQQTPSNIKNNDYLKVNLVDNSIQITNIIRSLSYKIFNSEGRLVKSRNDINENQNIALYNRGMYVIIIEQGSSIITKKIIIH